MVFSFQCHLWSFPDPGQFGVQLLPQIDADTNILWWREEMGEMSIFTLLHEKKTLLYEKILFQGLLLPTDPAAGN